MFTKRTKYFFQHTPSIFTHAIIFYILYETRCKIYHFIHFKQPTIDNTQGKNSKIHANNTNYMLLLNMIKKTRHIFKKMEQMTIIASCTCMRKKNSKQLDPRCTVFVTIEYQYMYTKHHPEENTAPIPQATMYVQ